MVYQYQILAPCVLIMSHKLHLIRIKITHKGRRLHR
ncbi:MAG: hypothetical protein RLZZ507_583 [Cyanobacteriota bacterium]|jgi:hypothetical protein